MLRRSIKIAAEMRVSVIVISHSIDRDKSLLFLFHLNLFESESESTTSKFMMVMPGNEAAHKVSYTSPAWVTQYEMLFIDFSLLLLLA